VNKTVKLKATTIKTSNPHEEEYAKTQAEIAQTPQI